MKKYILIIICLIFAINCWSQNYMEINFNKEIVNNDTCIRFYNVTNFDVENRNIWENISENLHNIVIITPSKREIYDKDSDPEYYSFCDKVFFYCIEGSISDSLLRREELNSKKLKEKVICIFDYNNGKLTKFR